MSDPLVFDPNDLAESNATAMPGPYAERGRTRWYRRLGPPAGLTNFGVNLVRIAPGGQSSYRHAHSTQDEFVMVLEGTPTLRTDAGETELRPGLCVGFPKGTGDAHHFVNRTAADVRLLVVGDRAEGDIVSYPDDDLHGAPGPDGRYVFTHKDGTPW